MSRLQEITKRLKSINGAVFQELCEAFLYMKNDNYRAFVRQGSQPTKQKTTKGTPDTFFVSSNGSYIFVEITTNVSDPNKFKNDIEDCFNKSEIPDEKIEEIILCFNFTIDSSKIDYLRNLAKEYNKNTDVSFYSLDKLSMSLNREYRFLVSEYLDLPLDTGQLVTVDTFIEEYNESTRGFSAPINNEFVHREDEKSKLIDSLESYDITVLTGPAGAGKTKLSIEAIKEFLDNHNTYNALCVSYKDSGLLDDLHTHFNNNEDNLLFVDDANKIDQFKQIGGFYKESREGDLKILITVRNYAFEKIEKICPGSGFNRIGIDKFDDSEIKDIVKSNPFNISNSSIQRIIQKISEGNPRLAVMAALLAKKNYNMSKINNVVDLFDEYFNTFANDNKCLDKKLRKYLGYISFFEPVDCRNKEEIIGNLENFNINYEDFIESLNKLENLELIKIKHDHAKISEQNISTYFFFKAFIEEDLLSFQTLLKKYFVDNVIRFRNRMIPVINIFGTTRVEQNTESIIKDYWNRFKTTSDKLIEDFLNIFWPFLQTEVLTYIYGIINSLESKNITVEETSIIDDKKESNDQSIVLNILSMLFSSSNNLRKSLKLSFKYIEKCPEDSPILLNKIKDKLSFDKNDIRSDFSRQFILFEIILDKLDYKSNYYLPIFYELASEFLSFKYEHTQPGRNNSVLFYKYPIPDNNIIKKFRKMLWDTIDRCFEVKPEESAELLEEYTKIGPVHQEQQGILNFDIQLILKIIDNNFSTDSFYHCKLVHDLIDWFKSKEITLFVFSKYLEKYTNNLYRKYLKLDWDRFRDKKKYGIDIHDYSNFKKSTIEDYFNFSSIEEIQSFYKDYVFLRDHIVNINNSYRSLDIVFGSLFSSKFNLGIVLLVLIIEDNNGIEFVPGRFFTNNLNTQNKVDTVLNLIQENTFKRDYIFEKAIYENIDETLITDDISESLLQLINDIDDNIEIYFRRLEGFLQTNPDIFKNMLKIIVNRNKNEEINLYTDVEIFDNYFNKIKDDIKVVEEAYIQQYNTQNDRNRRFDYGCKALSKILACDADFLFKLVKEVFFKDSRTTFPRNRDMSFVWKIENIEDQLSKIFDYVSEKELFGYVEGFCNCFFKNIDGKYQERADNFLLNYLKRNYNEPKKVGLVVNITKFSRKDLFDEILEKYISLNNDINDFKKIVWINKDVQYGYGINNEIECAEKWKNILSIVEHSESDVELIPIKQYIEERIRHYNEKADEKKRNRFLGESFIDKI